MQDKDSSLTWLGWKWHKWLGLALMYIGGLVLLFHGMDWLISSRMPSVSSISSPSAGEGWTAIGNGTRLQYVDLADDIRCFRRYYSDQLSCIQLTRER